MPPRELAGGFWFIPEGEYVKGPGGRIDGPAQVRVHEFPDLNKLSIQGTANQKGVQIEVNGLDFPSAVKQK